MEAVLGIFDQPFGDFYETQGPFWVNRFITAPLPYGSAALVPPSDIGMQLRGAYQWGQLGQDADYTVWAANGPSYDSDLPEPVVGQALNGSTNITTNTNGKAYGGQVPDLSISARQQPGTSGTGRFDLQREVAGRPVAEYLGR